MKKPLLIASAAYPASCLASGGDVLSLLWLAAALFGAVIVSLVRVRSASRKLMVFGAYLLGVALAVALTWNLPAEGNDLLGTVVFIGVPLLTWLGALVLVVAGKNITSRWKATR